MPGLLTNIIIAIYEVLPSSNDNNDITTIRIAIIACINLFISRVGAPTHHTSDSQTERLRNLLSDVFHPSHDTGRFNFCGWRLKRPRTGWDRWLGPENHRYFIR